MEIEQVAIPGGTTLRFTGRLDTESTPRVEPVVLAAAQTNALLLLDMTKLRYCSSAGLRLLLKLLREVQVKRGKLGLIAVQPAVQEVLETSGFDRLMPQFDTLDAATAGLR